ncbi:ATP-binding protein [bacterium]|nr:ATP-binding protein [bacterium]
MADDKRLLQVLTAINSISFNKNRDFGEKLQRIIQEIVGCMGVNSGSILLLKGTKGLEVVASTNDELIGVKQPLGEDSPSTWVVKNREPLYVDNISKSDIFYTKFDHYEKFSFLLSPILSNGKTIGVITVTEKIGEDLFTQEEQKALLNITAQVISTLENQRLTESIKKKERALRKKNLQLKKFEGLKVDLFNMLIHDLKGPISELVANLDILSYTVSEEHQEFVEAAKTGCDTLYGMVSNLLDIARLEEGKFRLVYERIEPQDLIKEALARTFGLVKIKELKFVEKYPTTLTKNVLWGDRGMLLRILQNLLTNAIKYSPNGETIEVGFEYRKFLKIKFFVKDKGPGVPPEFRETIFDKFFQLEKQRDGRAYTTGLGLTFCQMAVKAHKGKIDIDCDGSHGSCFFFVLPLTKSD